MSDWRITNQDKYLLNKQLKFIQYNKRLKENDHEHCEFCMNKFSDNIGDLNEGYCTLDEYYWICEQCFEDFKEDFHWNITK